MKTFLYGRKNTGKSTLIDEAVQRCGIVPDGFRTISRPGGRDGGLNLYLQPASGPVAFTPQNKVAVYWPDGSWESCPEVFDTEGVRLLTFTRMPRLVVMDELGFMEKDAVRFQERVMEILGGPCPVLGVIKPAAKAPGLFIERVYTHPGVTVLEVTEKNRDDRLLDVMAALMRQVSRGV